jgi:hypothetical protein
VSLLRLAFNDNICNAIGKEGEREGKENGQEGEE